MRVRMFIMGVFTTTILLVVMVVARMMTLSTVEDDFVLKEIETITLTPPPEPEIIEEEELEEVSEEIPPPAIELSEAPQLDVPVIVASDATVDPNVEFEMFTEDVAVANLPVVKKVDLPKKKNPIRPKVSKPRVKVAKPAPVKSRYSVGELDGVPRRIRTGSFVWPRGVSDSVVRARVEVEISESGRVRVLGISSLSNAKMRSVVTKLVRGSRYSSPKKNGRPVKARYSWPLTLKKPR